MKGASKILLFKRTVIEEKLILACLNYLSIPPPFIENAVGDSEQYSPSNLGLYCSIYLVPSCENILLIYVTLKNKAKGRLVE